MNKVTQHRIESGHGLQVGGLYRLLEVVDPEGDEVVDPDGWNDVYMCCNVFGENPAMVNLRTGVSYNEPGYKGIFLADDFAQLVGRVVTISPE